MSLRVKQHSVVNGYSICSRWTSTSAAPKFFIRWCAGEWPTLEAAEEAAREGNLRDYADRGDVS